MRATTRPKRQSRIKRGSIAHDFAKWLSTNRARFPARLRAYEGRGEYRRYKFEGVPFLRVWVGHDTLVIAVMYERRFMDLLGDFDVVPSRNAAGSYYCATCEAEGHAEYMDDRMALLASHSFEPLLEWCRDNIREDALLVLEGEPGRSTSARIVFRKDLKSIESRLQPGFIVEPVMPGSAARRRARRRRAPK